MQGPPCRSACVKNRAFMPGPILAVRISPPGQGTIKTSATQMSDEKEDRIIVRPESRNGRANGSQAFQRPVPRRRRKLIHWPTESPKITLSWSFSILGWVRMTKNLSWRVLEKIQEEIRQIDPTTSNSDGARVLLALTARTSRP